MSDIVQVFDYQSDEYPTYHFRLTATAGDAHAEGIVHQMHGPDPQEVATLTIKWDGCAHVGLRDPELGKNWVHVCGSMTMERYLAMLQWAWNTLAKMIPEDASECGVVENVSEPKVDE